LIKKEKEKKVDILKNDFSNNAGVIFADYSSLKSEQSMIIRNKLYETNSTFKIIKNTLAELALKESYLDMDFSQILMGPTSIVVSHEDIISTAKVLKELIKEFEVLKIKGGIIDGKLVDADTVNKLASLPSREILISQFMFNLASPIYTLVNVLNNLPKKLVMTLAAIQKEKEKVNS
jgi:large subunit ribosomal protein L10